MSLTSVSAITSRGAPPSLHTRPDTHSNDGQPSLRHIRDLFFSHECSVQSYPVETPFPLN